MAQLLPNSRQQFLDANGNPLAGGLVYFYIPNTTTPKDTWQDAGQTILNTNPVVCDARGQALIFGSGSYRQILKDAQGNSIWDGLVNSFGAGASNFVSDTDPVALASPFDIWSDTVNMLLKQRNAAGTAWITVGPLLSYGSPSLTFKAAPSAAADDVVVQSQVFGVGDSFDVVSRTIGTTYTNTSGKWKFIAALVTSSATGGYIGILCNGTQADQATGLASGASAGVSYMIPPGATYQYTGANIASAVMRETQ